MVAPKIRIKGPIKRPENPKRYKEPIRAKNAKNGFNVEPFPEVKRDLNTLSAVEANTANTAITIAF